MGETKQLAEFIVRTNYEHLPADTIKMAKRCVLDHLGVALFGMTQQWSQLVMELAREAGCRPESTIYGQSWQTSPQYAALVNGTAGHGFELDDLIIEARTHPGCVVVPAALSMGEREHIDGKRFLASVVMGYEIMGRLGCAAGASITMRGFHSTSTEGPFAAAAVGAKVLGLSTDQLVNAFGIAGSLSSGIKEFYLEGPMSKRFHAGWASQGGITAALLARKGFTGPSTVLEGKYGFLRVFSDEPDLARLTRDLGSDYLIRANGFKPYPCCGSLHSAIDAITQLMHEHQVTAQEIERAIIGAPELVVAFNGNYEPDSPMAAQYSLPYVVAGTLLGRVTDPSFFDQERLKDPATTAVVRKVELREDPEINAQFPRHHGARVTLVSRGGKELSKVIYAAKGTPANPLTAEEVKEKFHRLASGVIGEGSIEQIIQLVERLEHVPDMRELTALLRAEAMAPAGQPAR
ncbi:MAG: MmgE/PrpD family protein [Chloroflexi bacterium]|nr:MmgE/PrpD family protein [Chloroflexota bacterium]